MPRIALISDIHSNWPALQAVLADIDAQKVDSIYCLGDTVGYGPQPVKCMTKVIEVCDEGRMIAGNHDHAVVHEPIGFNERARRAARWTNSVVKAGMFSFFGGKKKRWNWLTSLPTSVEEENALYVHASPRDHLEEYLLEEYTRGISLMGENPETVLRENFELIKHLCFIGHTHRPGVITSPGHEWYSLERLDNLWEVDPRKAVINIGSVGQPRDGDPRSCYAIYDGETVEWRRVEYDIEAIQKEIYEIDELDNALADRLALGK